MKRTNIKPCFSQYISDFCTMVSNAKSDYEWNKSEVNNLDKLTQDYLHLLELGNLGYKGRARIATKLEKCRQLRRMSKDTVEILEPFMQFLESDRGKNMMNLIKDALGKTRKIEERMDNRIYRYKVLRKDDEIDN